VTETVLRRRGRTLVRRLRLVPGEAMPWHRDPFRRLSVVVRGAPLAIEYQDGGPPQRLELAAGQVEWDEPCERVHRAVNVGREVYEEIAVFFLDRPDAVAQPREG
jgi:hypothetical protein